MTEKWKLIQRWAGADDDGIPGDATATAILTKVGLLEAPLAPGERIGSLSEEFESAGRGPGAVSSGIGDPGGVSYGIWQIASKTGTAAAFMDAEGAPWRSQFGGALPGTPGFTQAWKAIASREAARFAEAQYNFIKRTHYDPAVKAVRAATGLNLDAQHNAVRDATWSVSVQHGRAAKILTDAVKKVHGMANKQPGEPAFARDLVNAIYDVRTAYVLAIGGRTMEGIARNRYPAERAKALAMIA